LKILFRDNKNTGESGSSQTNSLFQRLVTTVGFWLKVILLMYILWTIVFRPTALLLHTYTNLYYLLPNFLNIYFYQSIITLLLHLYKLQLKPFIKELSSSSHYPSPFLHPKIIIIF
jgi:hypothetical protein